MWVSITLKIALYHYLKTVDVLPAPNEALSSSISSTAIKDANEWGAFWPKLWRPCAKHAPKQQTLIGEYASLHGNYAAVCHFQGSWVLRWRKAAVHHFSKKLGVEVKESSVRTWRAKYQAEVDYITRNGETSDVQELTCEEHSRSLLLGEKLDDKVKSYIWAVLEGGGAIIYYKIKIH